MSDPLYLRGCQGCRESWVATLWTDGPLCLRCRGRAECQPDTREEIAATVAVRYPGKGSTCADRGIYEPGRRYGLTQRLREMQESAEDSPVQIVSLGPPRVRPSGKLTFSCTTVALEPVRREGPAEPFTWEMHDPGPRPNHVKRRG